jgi:pyruvate,water dikinase
VAEIDIGRARWREDPRSIFQTLTSYLKLTDPNLAPDLVYERNAREAERLRDEYVARLRRTPWGAIRANLLGGAIRRMRAMGGVRETPKFEGIKIFDLYRTALLEQGNRLVAQGKLERADDIFFVTYADLKAFAKGQALDLKAMVARQPPTTNASKRANSCRVCYPAPARCFTRACARRTQTLSATASRRAWWKVTCAWCATRAACG